MEITNTEYYAMKDELAQLRDSIEEKNKTIERLTIAGKLLKMTNKYSYGFSEKYERINLKGKFYILNPRTHYYNELSSDGKTIDYNNSYMYNWVTQEMELDPSARIASADDYNLKVTNNEAVNHPSHYAEGRKYEPYKVIKDWNLNFNLGNAVKYISRAGRKDTSKTREDICKAVQYLGFELEALDEEGK